VPGYSLADDETEHRAARRAGGPRGPRVPNRAKEVPRELSAVQRCDIAQRELEHARTEISHAKADSDKLLEALRASLEEIDLRIAEIKKENFEFKRDIVVGAENPRTGLPMAEKVAKYMDDLVRRKDAVVEKTKMKNASLDQQIRKVEVSLRQKDEGGESLHAIDFHQLEIENKQYLEKIEDRNQELLRLKLTTGSTVQMLTSLKKKLAALTSEQEWLKREIMHRDAALTRLSDEVERVTSDRDSARSVNDRAKHRERAFVMPPVMDYIDNKAEMHELRKAIKTYRVKVQIAEVNVKRLVAERNAIKRGEGGH
jgi:chromosome segregation ATPase